MIHWLTTKTKDASAELRLDIEQLFKAHPTSSYVSVNAVDQHLIYPQNACQRYSVLGQDSTNDDDNFW
jgi:hypothetical protein